MFSNIMKFPEEEGNKALKALASPALDLKVQLSAGVHTTVLYWQPGRLQALGQKESATM